MALPGVYLLASERSGTNLFRKLLSEHQDAYFGPPPAHFLKHLYFNEAYYPREPVDSERQGSELSLDGFRELVADAVKLCESAPSAWDLDLRCEKIVEAYCSQTQGKSSVLLADYLMRAYALDQGFRSYLCKDNHLFYFAFDILKDLPDAKFIYLYRDPRDYALSQKTRSLQTDSLYRISEMWRDEQIHCQNIVARLGGERCLSISYEQLVSASEKTLMQVCDFLSVPYRTEPKETKPAPEGSLIKEWENLAKPLVKDNFGKYQTMLSTREIALIERLCNRQMEQLGYTAETEFRPMGWRDKIWDRFALHAWSHVRRRFLPDKRDLWSVNRRRATRAIAARRLG